MSKIVKALGKEVNINHNPIQSVNGSIYKIKLPGASPSTKFRLCIPLYEQSVYSNEYNGNEEIILEDDNSPFLNELLQLSTPEGLPIGLNPAKFSNGVFIMINRSDEDTFNSLDKIDCDLYIDVTEHLNSENLTHMQEINYDEL